MVSATHPCGIVLRTVMIIEFSIGPSRTLGPKNKTLPRRYDTPRTLILPNFCICICASSSHKW